MPPRTRKPTARRKQLDLQVATQADMRLSADAMELGQSLVFLARQLRAGRGGQRRPNYVGHDTEVRVQVRELMDAIGSAVRVLKRHQAEAAGQLTPPPRDKLH